MSSDELQKALDAIDKMYGAGSVMNMTDSVKDVECINTGSPLLDIALGGKGLPRGRVVEIYGKESSGKTTLALHTIAEAQRAGGKSAFVDAEHALDISWARKLGVDPERLLISQPNSGEEALGIVELLLQSGQLDVIVVDSVAALIPEVELQGEMGQSHVGLQARMMSQAMRKLTGSIHKGKTLVIFINQLRMKIGVMYGNPETTPGGNALKYYASIRLDIRRIATQKDKEGTPIANRVRVKVVKNKIAPPFKEAEFDLTFDRGISKEADILDLAVKRGVVSQKGAWFYYEEEKWHGRNTALEALHGSYAFDSICRDLQIHQN